MRNLISLIIKNTHWLLFFLLLFVSVYMIIHSSNYQQSKYLSVEREVVGRVYSVSDVVTSYIGLRQTNEDLVKRIAELERQNGFMEEYIQHSVDTAAFREIFENDSTLALDFICGRVINNSISGLDNLITLNKGSDDGIEKDMGVFSPRGVVGIVMTTSSNYSVVIPILNSKSNISCKIRGSNYFGSLKWDGRDAKYAYLEELPRHVKFNIGDTIVTTGYSSVFPEGIRVGTVVDSKKQKNDDFYSLRIDLFTNFSTISEVLVVKNTHKESQRAVEEEARKMIKGDKNNGN